MVKCGSFVKIGFPDFVLFPCITQLLEAWESCKFKFKRLNMKEAGVKSALEVLNDVQPMQKVPQSWSYGTFHQNNPIYMNMLVAQE